jgi:hypothetical protein
VSVLPDAETFAQKIKTKKEENVEGELCYLCCHTVGHSKAKPGLAAPAMKTSAREAAAKRAMEAMMMKVLWCVVL